MTRPGSSGPDCAGDKDRHSSSFGPAAQAYDRARPSYPLEAVRRLIPDAAEHALDLGAGTGKLTEIVAGLVGEVIAVEPSSGMREQFARAHPDLHVVAGTAEQIPLPDNSVDVVLAAQAWHWVDPARAVPEVARVLRPGGWLGLIWNTRDERVSWVADLGAVLARRAAGFTDIGGSAATDPAVGAPFGAADYFQVQWNQRMTGQGLLDLVNTRSYVLVLTPDERAQVEQDVRSLLDRHPELVGRDEFDLPYLAQCWRYQLG